MTDPALRHRQARWAGWASLVANIGIVVTGGAVRLTGSGLGCPTWPRCTEEDFTPRGALDFHAAIEFGNRLLTFVLVAVAVLTFVAAVRTGRRHLVGLAVVLAAGIPLQAVIGGITVLTDLNPWIVSLHLLLSMALVGLSVRFLQVLDRPTPAVGGSPTAPATALIEQLEGDRGFYAGAVGWCDQRGDGRWVVSIRCAQLSADRRTALAHSGGGIVAESDPDDELAETTTKFRTILSALGVSGD